MNVLENWLHEATSVLLAPVLVALLCLLAGTLAAFGGFLRELLDRRAGRARWRDARWFLTDRKRPPDLLLGDLISRGRWPGLLGRFADAARPFVAERSRLPALASAGEIEASRVVSRLNLVARAGPTLGLMATLLPMGPALLALADDDVAQLARSLAVAFTATIVGLLVGLLGATMGTIRRHWYAADLAAVDEVLEALGEVRS